MDLFFNVGYIMLLQTLKNIIDDSIVDNSSFFMKIHA